MVFCPTTAVFCAAVTLGSLALASCSAANTASSSSSTLTVKHTVTGTFALPVTIEYADATSTSNSVTGQTLPWSYQFPAASGQVLYFKVTSPGPGTGTITLTLYENGNVVDVVPGLGPGIVWLDSGTLP